MAVGVDSSRPIQLMRRSAIVPSTSRLMRIGSEISIAWRMTGARIVVAVAVKETVGLGVPPGAEFVDDGVGEPVAEGRIVEEKDGVDDCEGVFDAEAPRERVEEGVCVDE